jgi:hypothetical protein
MSIPAPGSPKPTPCTLQTRNPNSPPLPPPPATLTAFPSLLNPNLSPLSLQPANLTPFLQQVLHPNITDQGQICLDIVADAWNPAVSRALPRSLPLPPLPRPRPPSLCVHPFSRRLQLAFWDPLCFDAQTHTHTRQVSLRQIICQLITSNNHIHTHGRFHSVK